MPGLCQAMALHGGMAAMRLEKHLSGLRDVGNGAWGQAFWIAWCYFQLLGIPWHSLAFVSFFFGRFVAFHFKLFRPLHSDPEREFRDLHRRWGNLPETFSSFDFTGSGMLCLEETRLDLKDSPRGFFELQIAGTNILLFRGQPQSGVEVNFSCIARLFQLYTFFRPFCMFVALWECKHLQFLPRMAAVAWSDRIVGQQPNISATVSDSQGILMFGIVEEKKHEKRKGQMVCECKSSYSGCPIPLAWGALVAYILKMFSHWYFAWLGLASASEEGYGEEDAAAVALGSGGTRCELWRRDSNVHTRGGDDSGWRRQTAVNASNHNLQWLQ